MKLFISFLIVAIVCCANAELTAEQKEKVKGYHKECIDVTGANPDLVKQAREGKFADDEKLKNHILCVSKKIGFQNDAGDIQTDVLKHKLGAALGDQAVADQLISTCAQPKANPAETAFQTLKCYYEKTPTHVSFI
uniref:Odorant-binding protein 28 n=1 Tax=Pyrrhalta maculicollis TaxID=226885 RepID=A0A1J0KKD4_9CUCU|nr:odorant-binding protein 28 [Pyrrhalta maculicollis]